MVAGWRKAFYTSKDKDSISKVLVDTHPQHLDFDNINGSPQNNLRCRTSDSNSSLSDHKSNNSPKWSSSSSPNSPSSYYTLLKSTLGLSKSLCGICSLSVKTGEGRAIFTAECSHTFHFPCIAAHVKNQQVITCPVCGTNWNDLQPEKTNTTQNVKTTTSLKLPNYNDDEPLLSSTSVSRFNTIPESDENEEEPEGGEDEENKEPIEFQGFGVSSTRTFDAFLLPESALMASNKSFETVIAVLKVKAKPCNMVANRPPVDLVTVLDIGCSVSGEDLLMLKHSMQVVISSLGSSDRLSVVAFSGGSKRLFPLRRMTGRGRRSARRIVDALVTNEVNGDEAPARKVALMKAAKILEDRRQKNPVTKVILLTNGYEDRRLSSTRFSHLEIPVHALNYSRAHNCSAFSESVGNLLRVVAHDIKFEFYNTATGEIAAVKSPSSAMLGDINAAEERELLVELKVPSSHGSHSHVLSVRSSYRDPFTQEHVHSKERLISTPRSLPVGSLDPKIKRLLRLHVHARTNADVKKYNPEMAHDWLRGLKAEEKVEPLTPISAWKAAEKLAKVAIMRKSLNKVSDLHGFEDARF